MLVYKSKQYGNWSCLCSNENNGDKLSCYLPVQFKKGEEPSGESACINVTSFFMSCFDSKRGVQPKMVILEYVITKEAKKEKDKSGAAPKTINGMEIGTDDLPFY